MEDIGSARNAVTLSPHDTTALNPIPRAIYVGVSGDITGRAMGSGTDVTFTAVPVGIFPVRLQYVRDTGTDADDLVALF